jgi:hypothetical protein
MHACMYGCVRACRLAASPLRSPGSYERVNMLLERSVRGADAYYTRSAHLEPVRE